MDKTRIYLTHCSAKKDNSLKGTNRELNPDKLYAAAPTQRFMKKCKEKGVNWAIFSDLYGVWFPEIKHRWYEKHPETVTAYEFKNLVNNFDQKLEDYREIWFYHNPGRFHPLYKELLQTTVLKDKVKQFTHLREIT